MSSLRRNRTGPRRAGLPVAAALAAVLCLAACSPGHHDPATTASPLPPGTITVDTWSPPALAGGPGPANFCAALTAIYRHTGELPHVLSKRVSEDILSDYVSYAPTVIAESPPALHASASAYMGAVASYLRRLVSAGLDLGRLPAGTLRALSAPDVAAAYASLEGYAHSECHYDIGGHSTAS